MKSDLRQAPLQRHLAAFETHFVVAARARSLPFRSAAARLSLSRSYTAAGTFAGLAGTAGGL
jgi:hypothetical protein